MRTMTSGDTPRQLNVRVKEHKLLKAHSNILTWCKENLKTNSAIALRSIVSFIQLISMALESFKKVLHFPKKD